MDLFILKTALSRRAFVDRFPHPFLVLPRPSGAGEDGRRVFRTSKLERTRPHDALAGLDGSYTSFSSPPDLYRSR